MHREDGWLGGERVGVFIHDEYERERGELPGLCVFAEQNKACSS
jgi:hypothetical protein